jgi:hypothetical protein
VPQDFFNFLLDVQNRLANMIKSVGKIDHSLYPFQIILGVRRLAVTNRGCGLATRILIYHPHLTHTTI